MALSFEVHKKKRKLFTPKRLKNWLLSLFGVSIILLAIAFTLVRVSIKAIPDYKESIQEEVARQLDLQLEVGSLDAEIHWLVPRLNLFDVNIYDAERKNKIIHINEVDLSMDWLATIKTGIPVINEIVLDGMNIQIGVNQRAELVLQDYVLQENLDKAIEEATTVSVEQGEIPVSDELKYLVNNLDFRILNSNIRLFHEKYPEYNKTLSDFNLRLLNRGDEHRFEVKTHLPEAYGQSARVIVTLEGDLFDYRRLSGQLYLAAENIRTAPWINDYWKGTALAINANINSELWLDWQDTEVTQLYSQFGINDVAVHYLDKSVKTRELDKLNGQVSWSKQDDGWVMNVRQLDSVHQGKPLLKNSALQLTKIDIDDELHLQANHLRIEGLSYLAGMMFSVDEKQVNWLNWLMRHKPQGDLTNLDVVLPLRQPESIRINTEFSGIGMAMPDMEPVQIQNIRGSIIYYGSETWLALDSDRVELKFNTLFRNTLELDGLRGVVKLAYTDDAFHINTDTLYMNTVHLSTENRLNLVINPDDVFMDLTIKILKGDAGYTSLYLPAGLMGPDAVAWLDRAIVGGQVTGGGYQFYGHFSEAPFNSYEGVSLADVDVKDVQLDYLEGWPQLTQLDANLRFLNDSMQASVKKAKVLDSSISNSKINISTFSSPVLDIDMSADTRLADVGTYLLDSGLKKYIPDYVSNLELGGVGDLDLELFIPLTGGHTEWGGTLTTGDGSVYFKKEKYKLEAIEGELRFADGFFEINGMQGRLDDQLLDINMHTRYEDKVFNYTLNAKGELTARSLLSPLPDYQRYVDGKSPWDISLNIYSGRLEPDLRLNLKANSRLEGTASAFYGPLAKARDTELDARFSMQLFSNSNIKYDLLLGDSALSLHEFSQNWVLTSDSDSIKGVVDIGKSKVDRPVRFDLDYLDIDKLVEVKATDFKLEKKQPYPRDIPSMDIKARQVKWKRYRFNELEMQTQQNKSGMEIKKLVLIADDYRADATAAWHSGWKGNHSTKIRADLSVNNLGSMLSKLGISEGIEGADGTAKLDIRWPGTPFEFNWKNLKGNAAVSFADGVIKDIEVGAGRMLGIFSYNTLFSLDFVSQLSSGFSFDRAQGVLNFVRGSAYSQNFVIESKVADMVVDGNMNILNSTVDQKIRIKPHIGSTLSFGSAVVAGPAVGGLVYLFHKIFDPDKLSEYEYSVKGKLKDPKVELLSSPIEEIEQEDDFDTDE